MDLDRLRRSLTASVRAAGARIEAIRIAGAATRHKADASPVTDADEAAEALLSDAIRALTPELPIVGEEAFAAGFVPEDCGATFWLIDPLDGTADFVRGGSDYTVNVALVVEHASVLGLVLTPRDGLLWSGGPDLGAFRQEAEGAPEQPIRTVACQQAPVRVLASRTHGDALTDAFMARLPHAKVISRGSSLKLCLIAEGLADIYPRWGSTSEWDIAAGQAVLAGAGGAVLVPPACALPLRYGKPGFANTPFIAVGDAVGAREQGLLAQIASL